MDHSVQEFLRHVFESWVLAQHVYWSVGRGLADARAQIRVLLRLKVILDEGGWTLAPGATRGNPPVPTADRLHTVITPRTGEWSRSDLKSESHPIIECIRLRALDRALGICPSPFSGSRPMRVTIPCASPGSKIQNCVSKCEQNASKSMKRW
jgi:hypothetical protein